ncbi:Uu.00g019680.m01.CDS01 [Anthostomella pinea]|uniref:superoxide dismutase n=1 Tax=Anthostomella pinea TaxID=933095 RepID=A0AAI8YQN1_9PEZI|nr:Uu.00g019680.m01.CDS01 [Anthostomella pinea]
MRLSNIISVSALGASGVLAQNATTGKLGDALVVSNNPAGKSVIGTLPTDPFFKAGSLNGNVVGSVKATSGPGGRGVDYEVSFSSLPTEGGNFSFHIHDAPVPTDGNCTGTLAHLDPFIRGEDPVCDSTKPATCQVGDLAGKYGKITSDPYTAKFHDDFTSLVEGVGSYFANRSFVVHFANKTRITCANFAILDSNSTYTPTPSGGVVPTAPGLVPAATSTRPVTAAAGALNIAKHFAVAPVMALLLAL